MELSTEDKNDILDVVEEEFKIKKELTEEFFDKHGHLSNSEHFYYLLYDLVTNRIVPKNSRKSARDYFLSSPKMFSSNEKIESMLELFLFTQDIVEGIYQCGNCGSRRAIPMNKQVRSADEITSNTVVCVDCGNKWTE